MDVRIGSDLHYSVVATINGDATGAGTGEIQKLTLTIDPGTGTLAGTITMAAKNPIPFSFDSSQSVGIPTGYFMTWNPKGAWIWDSARNGLTYSSVWVPA